MAVITSPLRVTNSASGTDGDIRMSPSSASSASKSSARQVHTTENTWRVTVIASATARLSNSSATCSADRVAVPRSMTRDRRCTAPGASAGSQIDPARIARLIVTAGVVFVSFAKTTTPLSRRVRDGARPV